MFALMLEVVGCIFFNNFIYLLLGINDRENAFNKDCISKG